MAWVSAPARSIFDAIPGLLLTPAELDELPEIQIVDAAGDQLWSSFRER